MRNDTQIIGSGAKRMRHGSYCCIYTDNHGRTRSGRIRYGIRAEIQTANAGGCVRLRKWFKYRADAERWLGSVVNRQRLQDMGIASKY